MPYSKDEVLSKLHELEQNLNGFVLPKWEEIPDFGLYMEQVLSLLKQYLDFFPTESRDEQFITAAAINNYVRNNVMPEPVKKRYYRIHLAYLIIILTLKQSLSLALIQKLIPKGLSSDELRDVYTAYTLRHSQAARYFMDQTRIAEKKFYDPETVSADPTKDFIASFAIAGGFARLLAERLLISEPPEPVDEEKPKEEKAKK